MQESWSTRASLLERAQDQEDHSAWDEFVLVYERFIGAVIARSGVNSADIDDVVQDVLIKVWKSLPNYEYRKDKTKFRTWLGTIVRNAIYDYLRKLKRRGGEKFELDEELACDLTEEMVERQIDEEWRLHLTDMAIDNVKIHFSGQAIEVFLKSLNGASAKEIADDLDVTVESVYVLRRRVKISLQKEIKELRKRVEFN